MFFSILRCLAISLTAGSVMAAPVAQNTVETGVSSSANASVDFQVSGPLLSVGDPVYQQVIVQHTFSNSFGQPFVGTINYPNVDFTHVFLTIETTSTGIQYDRLAKIYLNGAEIWRTSTSEPAGSDIYFTYTKDVSRYVSLFKIPDAPIVMDLGNIVNDQYTGPFNVQITAKYYNVASSSSSNSSSVFNSYYERKSATNVTPLRPSSQSKTSAFSWSIPQQLAQVSLDALPRNTTRAVLDIFASGNANEEFWYMNFLDENANAIPSDPQQGGNAARIVKATINDDLVAVTLPFPVVYSGGFSPGLWIPVIGINAYDVPSYQIDVTPYLPKLWDGASITLYVDNGYGGVPYNEWFVNANLLTWQEAGVTGNGEVLAGTKYNDTNKFSNADATNSIVELQSVARDVSTRAILNFTDSDGFVEEAFVSSTQTISFTNTKHHYTNGGSFFRAAQVSSGYNSFKISNAGTDLSQYRSNNNDPNSDTFSPVLTDLNTDSNLLTVSEWTFIYPLAMNYFTGSSNSFQVDINRGYGYDDNYLTVWTKQNVSANAQQSSSSSITTSSSRGDQYYAQNLVQLSGGRDNYDQYVVTNNNKVVQNTYGNGNSDSLLQYGQSDPITTLVSYAAKLAQSNPSDKTSVTNAILNVFTTVLPQVSFSSTSSKRDAIKKVDDYDESWLDERDGDLFRSPGHGYPAGSIPGSDLDRRDDGSSGLLASKIAEFQVGWDWSNDTVNVCWTCKVACTTESDCTAGYVYSAGIPGTASELSKRGEGNVESGVLVGLGRNPMYHGTKNE
ncbi:uncharacterized protein SAPINGB_P001803 [Magnusiomyces paraingens]|uniref:Peptide N-acetyl-beta-D-glucosaminyl asparaginase amidase A N-terminal domain-containing protein n=1 Tax=Magnusiomyces paraingens TaxID=2606893 RepID=A0A5E8BBJ5_9ASCO|nr:uncharacterized protein SAPINGB_P001803 [Saprochaete ingens]VVT48486.1 unnamed protein product [Saprochaete ingens]